MAGRDSDAEHGATGHGDPVYSYKAAIMGAPLEYRLKSDRLAWAFGIHSGTIRFDRIRRLRLSFRPVTLQPHRFLAEIWSDDAPKMKMASTTWRSMVEQRRQDPEYRAFITELHRRLAAGGHKVRFTAGVPVVTYGAGVLVSAVVALAFIGVLLRVSELGQWTGVVLVALFFLVFGWQIGSYLYRNLPQTYRADAIPDRVLPSAEPASPSRP